MAPDSAAIIAKSLIKRFGSFTAVTGISFEVQRGEVFGVLGPNGAGKTTLVRMLTTLLRPSAGSATVAGYDVVRAGHRVRRRIGVIPQALTSDLDLTGWENLDIYGKFYGIARRPRRQRASQLLEMVGLRERANDLVATYSGGMRRRLEIARGLIHQPEVLFLDEPTLGLDPQSRHVVWNLLKGLRQESRITISLTTHYMEEADTLCDRIAIVDGGRIIALDTPAGLRSTVAGSDRIEVELKGDCRSAAAALQALPYLRAVEAGPDGRITITADDGAHVIPRIISEIEAGNGYVASINVRRVSLEDVFIRFTRHSLRDEPARKVSLLVGAGMPQRRD